jgi:hypothetical protein
MFTQEIHQQSLEHNVSIQKVQAQYNNKLHENSADEIQYQIHSQTYAKNTKLKIIAKACKGTVPVQVEPTVQILPIVQKLSKRNDFPNFHRYIAQKCK